jgi:ketosteroid isomerase-like protein
MRITCRKDVAWIGLQAYALIACVLLSLAGCHRTPAEQAIRETIAAMQKAGDAHDVGGVIAPMSDDFVGTGDEAGEPLDRKGFERFLRLLQLRESDLRAHLGPITVALQGTDHATADFTMAVTGGSGLLPDDGRIEQVHTGWRLQGSDWKLISAEWKASGADK